MYSGDVLDRASDDISLRAADYVCDTISRIDDSTGEGAVSDTVERPEFCECEHSVGNRHIYNLKEVYDA